jgi:hypothetical protein
LKFYDNIDGDALETRLVLRDIRLDYDIDFSGDGSTDVVKYFLRTSGSDLELDAENIRIAVNDSGTYGFDASAASRLVGWYLGDDFDRDGDGTTEATAMRGRIRTLRMSTVNDDNPSLFRSDQTSEFDPDDLRIVDVEPHNLSGGSSARFWHADGGASSDRDDMFCSGIDASDDPYTDWKCDDQPEHYYDTSASRWYFNPDSDGDDDYYWDASVIRQAVGDLTLQAVGKFVFKANADLSGGDGRLDFLVGSSTPFVMEEGRFRNLAGETMMTATDSPSTCDASHVGTYYFDTSEDFLCVCVDNGGSPQYERVDDGTVCN